MLHVILPDPEALDAYRFENGSLLHTQLTSLDLPTGSIPFGTAGIFEQLAKKLSVTP